MLLYLLVWLFYIILLNLNTRHSDGKCCEVLTRSDDLQKSSPADKRSLRGFKKRVLLYESAGAAVLDEFFNGMWADL